MLNYDSNSKTTVDGSACKILKELCGKNKEVWKIALTIHKMPKLRETNPQME